MFTPPVETIKREARVKSLLSTFGVATYAEVGLAFIFAVTPMMVLTLVDPDKPHPFVLAAGALMILIGEWEEGDIMSNPDMHDGLFLKGGPMGSDESYYEVGRGEFESVDPVLENGSLSPNHP